MSTLKVNDIEEATVGGAKIWPSRAWVYFNQVSTQSIIDDGNVSSITDVSVGITNITLSNAMTSSNYAINTSIIEYTAGSNGRVISHVRGSQSGGSTQTTTLFGFANHETASSGTLYDFASNYAVVTI